MIRGYLLYTKVQLESMRNQENANSLRSQISLYFDNALSKDECDSLLNRVNDDPRCSKMFTKEKNFRDFIKNNVKRPSVSPDLIQSIKENIRFH